jgi:indolepyruvate ferredoxin oxidoreductase
MNILSDLHHQTDCRWLIYSGEMPVDDIKIGRKPPAHDYDLADRYRADDGTVFLTGVQALARVPIEQLRRDRRAGRKTAALVSGYPGSPLGGFDLELAKALRIIGPELPITHLPAVNEELGASAVMGSQLAATRTDCRYDGVVGVWYGKAPGLDRAGDALRHGVFAGSSATGGALALVGDDPSAKSSTMPSSSDAALVDLHMPILYPATVAECLELGLHGIAMSRGTGLWSALKVVTAVADGNGTVHLPALDREPIVPTVDVDGRRWVPHPSAQFLGPRMVEVEREFHEIRTVLALRYGIENELNQVPADPADAWLGVVATGFTFGEVLEAFRRLGFESRQAIADAGIRLLNLRMPVPFDRDLVAHFARGLEQIFVVEEKNPTLERLVRDALYATTMRPQVVGKDDAEGNRLLPSYGQLDGDVIEPALRTRLQPRLSDRLAPPAPPQRERLPLTVQRAPYFCSGCPHNWGTKVPDGAVVGMGTGCHGMTLLMDPERVGDSIGITAMGNEGAQWLGMAPFVETKHVFQNFGDGTFFHSGQLAIQAAIGAGANVTFKILYNHTVAMTGGQDASHSVGPVELATILLAHGAGKVVITTDDTSLYSRRSRRYRGSRVPSTVSVHDRTELVELERRLAGIPGVTVIIHDQACAAELRRARKRGLAPTPRTRVVINHRICEGCGDCGDVSNCLSVQPVDTPLGRKTQIDQAGCNYDYSCLKGDCPAFMTIEVDGREPSLSDERALPDPSVLAVDEPRPVSDTAVVRLAGIGGTGVVTVAQVIGTAAMLDGHRVSGLDQTGLSQKAGPVISDVIIHPGGDVAHRSNLAGRAQADLLLAFDLMVAAADGALGAVSPRTTVLASTTQTPTGRQITDPGLSDRGAVAERLRGAIERDPDFAVDAAETAGIVTGVAATANMILVGAALQSGRLPVSLQSLRQAVQLNGVAVEANLAALEWGRRLWADTAAAHRELARWSSAPDGGLRIDVAPLSARLAAEVERALAGIAPSDRDRALVEMLTADLVDYQDEAYARRFLRLVARGAATGHVALTMAMARGFHKLMAYKDEYEVARLMTRADGLAPANRLATSAPPPPTDDSNASLTPDPPLPAITWHLHPPTLKPVLSRLGHGGKVRIPASVAPVFRALARGKRLRGTRFDPFGMTAMRRLERELIDDYEAVVGSMLDGLSSTPVIPESDMEVALAVARLPEMVRGFEELKMRRVAEYRAEQQRLRDRLIPGDRSSAVVR